MKKLKIKRKPLEGWKKNKKGFSYYFKKRVGSRYNITKITFAGFKKKPVGLSLYESGGGFNMRQVNKIGGNYLLDFFKVKFNKKLNLTVFASQRRKDVFEVNKTGVSINVAFPHFTELLKNLGNEIKSKRDILIQQRLYNFFPKEFKNNSEESVSVKLSDVNLNSLEQADHAAITLFIKKYISLNAENDKVIKELQTDLVIQGKKKTLDQVIKKFERLLKNKKLKEKKWQKFLHEEVFFFVSNYVESIRESNVNFGNTEEGEKKPDFVWIDLYGFLDVFEIKTPQTCILAKRIDGSHKNYYFSSDAAKAISQIEKYIFFLEKNVKNFQKYLSRQTKIPFSVLKPKAFLIIGNSKELEKNEDKKKDFRVLRRLFKNIEFITFDELLDNLRNLSSKFEKEIK